jgi:cyanate permease
VKGFSPFAAGVAFLPMTLVNFITALLVPRLTRQLGNSRLLSLWAQHVSLIP